MPDHNPYGEPIPTARVDYAHDVLRHHAPGPDPRKVVADTLRLISAWGDISYRQIADDIEAMQPNDDECALCGYRECENGCPMMRWRGQA